MLPSFLMLPFSKAFLNVSHSTSKKAKAGQVCMKKSIQYFPEIPVSYIFMKLKQQILVKTYEILSVYIFFKKYCTLEKWISETLFVSSWCSIYSLAMPTFSCRVSLPLLTSPFLTVRNLPSISCFHYFIMSTSSKEKLCLLHICLSRIDRNCARKKVSNILLIQDGRKEIYFIENKVVINAFLVLSKWAKTQTVWVIRYKRWGPKSDLSTLERSVVPAECLWAVKSINLSWDLYTTV